MVVVYMDRKSNYETKHLEANKIVLFDNSRLMLVTPVNKSPLVYIPLCDVLYVERKVEK